MQQIVAFKIPENFSKQLQGLMLFLKSLQYQTFLEFLTWINIDICKKFENSIKWSLPQKSLKIFAHEAKAPDSEVDSHSD